MPNLKKILTDTVPLSPDIASGKIIVLSIIPLLVRELKKSKEANT